jgi:hypothetical protein
VLESFAEGGRTPDGELTVSLKIAKELREAAGAWLLLFLLGVPLFPTSGFAGERPGTARIRFFGDG